MQIFIHHWNGILYGKKEKNNNKKLNKHLNQNYLKHFPTTSKLNA